MKKLVSKIFVLILLIIILPVIPRQKAEAALDEGLIAHFTFDELEEGVFKSPAGIDAIAVPYYGSIHAEENPASTISLSEDTISGSAAGHAVNFQGTTGTAQAGGFLRVTKSDGTSLLSDLSDNTELTISYYSKTANDGGLAGWIYNLRGAFTGDDYRLEYERENYLGVTDLTNQVTAERFATGARPASARAEFASRGKYKHVAIVYNLEDTKIYIDGELKATQSYGAAYRPAAILGNNSVFKIGKADWGDNGEYYTGLLDEFSVYNRSLREDEIRELAEKSFVPVTSVSITGNAGRVGVNATVSLQVTVLPEDATDRAVEWTSSDPSIAVVNSQGSVTGVRKGKATITARAAAPAEGLTVSDTREIEVYQSFTVRYLAGAGGRIIGQMSQRVEDGASTQTVKAEPVSGYKFVRWSDEPVGAASMGPVRSDSSVASNAEYTALFEEDLITITYKAGDGGKVRGSLWAEGEWPDEPQEIVLTEKQIIQTVHIGDTAEMIEAIPDEGYEFVEWDDKNNNPGRQDSKVYQNMTVTAIFQRDAVTQKTLARLNDTIMNYSKTRKAEYTAASWANFEKALTAAKKTAQDNKASKTQLDNAGNVLTQAYGKLSFTQVVVNKAKYRITKSASAGATVTYLGSALKLPKNITIPKTIKYSGSTYKVTEVAGKALKGKKTLKSVTIGANITKIGKAAFENNQNLKKIVFEGKAVKSVGKNAFRKIGTKAVIKCPKSKCAVYRKLVKNKGKAPKKVIFI